MNEGQKASQTSSKDTDLCGILTILENCSIPKVDIQNAQHLSEVCTTRITTTPVFGVYKQVPLKEGVWLHIMDRRLKFQI